MNSAKSWLFLILSVTLVSNTAFAWGSKPDRASDKLDALIEKHQEETVDQALEKITEQIQENAVQTGGK